MCGSGQSKVETGPVRLEKRAKDKNRWLEDNDEQKAKELEMINQENLFKSLKSGQKSSYVGDNQEMNEWKTQIRDSLKLDSNALLAMDNIGAQIKEQNKKMRKIQLEQGTRNLKDFVYIPLIL